MIHLSKHLVSVLRGTDTRAIFVRSGALGDNILLQPSIRLLKNKCPQTQIRVVGSAWARRIRNLLPDSWDFAPYDSAAMTRLFTTDCLSLPPALEDGDAIIVYTSNTEGKFAENIQKLHSGHTILHPVSPPPGTHAAVHLASALTRHKPSVDELHTPRLEVPNDHTQEIRERINMSLSHLTLLHPGSGSPQKCWPAHRYALLAQQLEQNGVDTIGLRGPADAQQCRRVSHEQPSMKFFVNSDLTKIAALLDQVAVCVTNDSGIGHLAAALGTPVVSIFGPTDPRQWRPLGPKTTVLQAEDTDEWPDVQQVTSAVMQWL